MTQPPVLSLPDLNKSFVVETKVVKNTFLTWHGTYNINSTRKLES
jgi:hypothetical protein